MLADIQLQYKRRLCCYLMLQYSKFIQVRTKLLEANTIDTQSNTTTYLINFSFNNSRNQRIILLILYLED